MDYKLKDTSTVSVSRIDLCNTWLSHTKETRCNELLKLVLANYDQGTVTEDSVKDIKKKISQFSSKIQERWEKVSRIRKDFFVKYCDWIHAEDISFKIVSVRSAVPSTSSDAAVPGPGRPKIDISEASGKTKRRRVEDLIHERSSSELLFPAQVSARLSGSEKVARGIQQLANESGGNSVTSKNNTCDESARCLTNEEALAYYVDNKSTAFTYSNSRRVALNLGHNLYPSLHCVRKAKKECYPPEEQIFVNETRVEIKLQAILDKTAERFVIAEREVIRNLLPSSISYKLISKWGCDGSSGHSKYKQKFNDNDATDEYMFAYSFVALQLRDDKGNIVWHNSRPSSTMNCRPIKFIYSKETKDITITETNKILDEINCLLPTTCIVDWTEIKVEHELLLTMTDGKVCNTLTGTLSAQRCFICGATPTQMNQILDFTPNPDNLRFGISPLHAWIRCFECLLHISYRLCLDNPPSRLTKKTDKDKVKEHSETIQNLFKIRMGLIVDKPKPGFGNSNDGNKARRFFENAELSAEITGLDVTLIKKIDILLRAVSSGYEINIDAFKKLAGETWTLYLRLYKWYYMPVTVHKLLVHSVDIIQSALLPIGQLSEEAQEARNKDLRRFREHHTKKKSRIATNRDLMNMSHPTP